MYRMRESRVRKMKHLLEEVGHLLGDNQASDIIIISQGHKFPCHKAILAARSQTFAAGFQNNFKETCRGEWEIKDADVEAVENMLNYI